MSRYRKEVPDGVDRILLIEQRLRRLERGPRVPNFRKYTGYVASQSNSSAIGTTEAVALTTPSVTFRAGKAYRIAWQGRIALSATNSAIARLRLTDATGRILAIHGTFGPQPSVNAAAGGETIVIGTSTDLAAVVVLTLQASATTVTQQGASDDPRWLAVEQLNEPSSFFTNARSVA